MDFIEWILYFTSLMKDVATCIISFSFNALIDNANRKMIILTAFNLYECIQNCNYGTDCKLHLQVKIFWKGLPAKKKKRKVDIYMCNHCTFILHIL